MSDFFPFIKDTSPDPDEIRCPFFLSNSTVQCFLAKGHKGKHTYTLTEGASETRQLNQMDVESAFGTRHLTQGDTFTTIVTTTQT